MAYQVTSNGVTAKYLQQQNCWQFYAGTEKVLICTYFPSSKQFRFWATVINQIVLLTILELIRKETE